jgi:hypothetical protein
VPGGTSQVSKDATLKPARSHPTIPIQIWQEALFKAALQNQSGLKTKPPRIHGKYRRNTGEAEHNCSGTESTPVDSVSCRLSCAPPGFHRRFLTDYCLVLFRSPVGRTLAGLRQSAAVMQNQLGWKNNYCTHTYCLSGAGAYYLSPTWQERVCK